MKSCYFYETLITEVQQITFIPFQASAPPVSNTRLKKNVWTEIDDVDVEAEKFIQLFSLKTKDTTTKQVRIDWYFNYYHSIILVLNMKTFEFVCFFKQCIMRFTFIGSSLTLSILRFSSLFRCSSFNILQYLSCYRNTTQTRKTCSEYWTSNDPTSST